jgi:hypothetical protein
MALTHDSTNRTRRIWSAQAPLDPSLRMRFYGRIQPMEKPGLLAEMVQRLRALF